MTTKIVKIKRINKKIKLLKLKILVLMKEINWIKLQNKIRMKKKKFYLINNLANYYKVLLCLWFKKYTR
jgi:hypothetical protein